MRLYLSGVIEKMKDKSVGIDKVIDLSQYHILQSFAYAKEKDAEYYPQCKSFMMDSGAFTLMMSKSKSKNFDIKKFTTNYGNFIKKNNIDNFVELDVDGIYGVDTYVDMLHLLQDITGKDPVRVFHGWRGKDYFKELVKQKERICLGGVAVGKARARSLDYFQWFLDEAHRNYCKVHGLAITSDKLIRKYNFDSVDSSTWSFSIRGGWIYRFDGSGLSTYEGSSGCTGNERISNAFCMQYALKEWGKLSQYVDKEFKSLYD